MESVPGPVDTMDTDTQIKTTDVLRGLPQSCENGYAAQFNSGNSAQFKQCPLYLYQVYLYCTGTVQLQQVHTLVTFFCSQCNSNIAQ